jgi:aminopeptidase N
MAEAAAHEADLLTEDEARSRAERVSRVRYELELDLHPDPASGYSGSAAIRFACHDRREPLFLDFTRTRLLALRVNGRELPDPGPHPHRILLPESLIGHENLVEVRWHNDYDRTGVGLHAFLDPEDSETYLFTDFEPYHAHRVFPCFDQPDLKAVYALSVEAPSRWTIIANGAEVDSEPASPGRTRRRFAVLPPFSTYLFAVIAGPYVSRRLEAEGVPLGIHCRRSLEPHLDADEIFGITACGLRFYREQFGLPYAFGKYDQVFVPEFNSGAMENVGAVTFNEAHVFRDPPTRLQRLRRAEVVLHELAHMWFGNLVTMRWWNDLWLNESFATFIAFLALAEATPFTDAWLDFLGSVKTWAYREDQKPTTHPIACTVADTAQTFLNFDGITYGKGAAILKQLHAGLGPEAFARGLRIYFARHAYGNTVAADFLAALGEGAGRDLGPWAEAWLQTSGVNTVAVRRRPGGAELLQERGNGSAVLRPHVLQVGFHGASDGRVSSVIGAPVALSGERAVAAGPQDAFLVWPNEGDAAYVRTVLDEQSLEALPRTLPLLPDPLLRVGLIVTLSDMLREVRVGPRAALAVAEEALFLERHSDVADHALRLVTLILQRYLPLAEAAPRGARLLDHAEQAASGDGDGSDLARVWLRAAPGLALSADAARRLRGWCASLPLVASDQGLRWRILGRAAAFDLPGTRQELERELDRDPSDRGRKARFAAEVAFPDAASKERVWTRFFAPGDESADFLKSGMSAFFQPHQHESLARYVDAYLGKLRVAVATLDLEYVARGLVRLLFPHAFASPALIAEARGMLEAPQSDPPVLRRLLREEIDEMERTLRIRSRA